MALHSVTSILRSRTCGSISDWAAYISVDNNQLAVYSQQTPLTYGSRILFAMYFLTCLESNTKQKVRSREYLLWRSDAEFAFLRLDHTAAQWLRDREEFPFVHFVFPYRMRKLPCGPFPRNIIPLSFSFRSRLVYRVFRSLEQD